MFGDWKRDCTSRTLVDSAFAGSQALASFFSAPVSFDDSGSAITSTTSQKPTTTHLVQLPAGISVSVLATLFIDSPGSAGGQHGLSGCRPQDQPSDGPGRTELSGGPCAHPPLVGRSRGGSLRPIPHLWGAESVIHR